MLLHMITNERLQTTIPSVPQLKTFWGLAMGVWLSIYKYRNDFGQIKICVFKVTYLKILGRVLTALFIFHPETEKINLAFKMYKHIFLRKPEKNFIRKFRQGQVTLTHIFFIWPYWTFYSNVHIDISECQTSLNNCNLMTYIFCMMLCQANLHVQFRIFNHVLLIRKICHKSMT